MQMTTYAPLKMVEVVEVTYSDGEVEDWVVGPDHPYPIAISMKRTVTYAPAAEEPDGQADVLRKLYPQ